MRENRSFKQKPWNDDERSNLMLTISMSVRMHPCGVMLPGRIQNMKKMTLVLLVIAAVVVAVIMIVSHGDSWVDSIGRTSRSNDVTYKPVIYLYPKQEEHVSVKLHPDAGFICTYPRYEDGWEVTASPDGTLKAGGKQYNYLYWEGRINTTYDFSKGSVVKGEETAAFLEKALEEQGLTRREANEFIVYWLPQMEKNPYNLISFQTRAYTDHATLSVEPEPDHVIRVFMAWKPVYAPIDIVPQTFKTPERNGFTVVEWGGAEVID